MQQANPANALSAGARTTATSNETSGPKMAVTGERTKAGRRMLVLRSMFIPFGANMSWVTKGSSPCEIAWGTQARYHTSCAGSP